MEDDEELMIRLKKTAVLFITLSLTLFLIQCSSMQTVKTEPVTSVKQAVVIRSVRRDFDDVWDSLRFALNQRGMVISSVSHIQEMLDRTGKALGRTKKIYLKAKVMEFCSAVISRNMLERNPHFISFCPYQIMVYTLPDNDERVYLSYRRLIWNDNQDRDVLEAVERLLHDLVQDVVDEYGEYREQ
jgi:uncharacterized protein (DUF302 family)